MNEISNLNIPNLKNDVLLSQPPIIFSWIWYTIENRVIFSSTFYQETGIANNPCSSFNIFFDIIICEDLLFFLKSIDDILKGAAPRWVKLRIINSSNTIKTIFCHLEPLSDEYETVFDIIGTCMEIIE